MNYKEKINELLGYQIIDESKPDDYYRLAEKQYDSQTIMVVIETMLSNQLTMGKKVKEFETKFAHLHTREFGIMTNSGSSALLMVFNYINKFNYKNTTKEKRKVITTMLNWSTPIFALLEADFIPVFVDVNIDDFAINYNEIEDAIDDETCGILITHLMGNPVFVKPIIDLAEKHNLWVVEDVCESVFSRCMFVSGMLGDFACFSFYFTHQLSTIEGGMILTNNMMAYNALLSRRAHGWSRDRTDESALITNNKHLDPAFLFVDIGFNFRPTEINAAIGLLQLENFEKTQTERLQTVYLLNEILHEFRKGGQIITTKNNVNTIDYTITPFCYYMIMDKEVKERLVTVLKANKIECRPIAMGKYSSHPIGKNTKWLTKSDLINTDRIFNGGLYIGIHDKFEEVKVRRIGKILHDFFSTEFVQIEKYLKQPYVN